MADDTKSRIMESGNVDIGSLSADYAKSMSEIVEAENQLKKVTEGTANELKRLGLSLDEIAAKMGKMNVTINDSAKNSAALQKAAKLLGIEFKVLSKEAIDKQLADFKELQKMYKDLPENMQVMADKMEKTLNDLGVKTKTFGDSLKTTVESGTKSLMTDVQRQVRDVLPPGLEKLGVWGLIIGSVAAVESLFKTESAGVLAAWNRAGAGINSTIDDIKPHLQSFKNEWKNLLSKEDVENVFAAAAGGMRSLGGETALLSGSIDNLADRTVHIDKFLELGAGSTMQTAVSMMTRYGRGINATVNDIDRMGSAFRNNAGPMNVYMQTVMDMSARMGPLGQDIKNVAGTLKTMTDQSEKAHGGLAQAQAATEEMFGFFSKMGMPMEAMIGQAMNPAASAATQIVNTQRIISGFTQGKAGFGEQMPNMLADVFKKYGLFSGERSKDETILILEQSLGFSKSTAILLGDMIAKNKGNADGFIAEFKSNKAVQKAMVSEQQTLKNLLDDTIPAWTKILNGIITILTQIIGLITDGITSIIAIIVSLAGKALGLNTMSPTDTLTLTSRILTNRTNEVKKAFTNSGSDVLSGLASLVPGVGLLGKVINPAEGQGNAPSPSPYSNMGSTGMGGFYPVGPSSGGPGGAAGAAASELGPSTAPGGGGDTGGAPDISGGPSQLQGQGFTEADMLSGGGLLIQGNFKWTLNDAETSRFKKLLEQSGKGTGHEASRPGGGTRP